MPTRNQVALNRFMTLHRLSCGDNLVWTPNGGEVAPEAVWFERQPQLGRPTPWLTTFRWLRSRRLIVEVLPPPDSHYRGSAKMWRLFKLTPAGEAEFINMRTPDFEAY